MANKQRKWPNGTSGAASINLGVQMEARVQSMKKERGVNSHDFNKLKSTKIAEYPLHQLICLGLLEIHIALSNPSINVRTFSQGHDCVAIVSRSILCL